jgi:toxin ParE1/3/4
VRKYKLTPAAREHLKDIWDYSVEQWGSPRTEKYLLEIQTVLEQLGGNPDLGRHRPEVREGYDSFPVGSHVVFYLKARNHIQIIGVLHGRMDVDARLLE